MFSVVELHRLCQEGRTAWQPLVLTLLIHFHTQSFQATININISSNINRINSRFKNNMLIIHPRPHREAASALNWLVIYITQLTMKMLQFRTRWVCVFPAQHSTQQTTNTLSLIINFHMVNVPSKVFMTQLHFKVTKRSVYLLQIEIFEFVLIVCWHLDYFLRDIWRQICTELTFVRVNRDGWKIEGKQWWLERQ